MPALAMVTVCCSMTSCIATRSMSDILSNSSMQTTPRSARTIAPASRRRSPVSRSVVTAAVKPTPELPRPVVAIARGAVPRTNRRSCDFAVDGSPTMSRLMSPRICVPFRRFFSAPPRRRSRMASLILSCPKIEGASDWDSNRNMSRRLASWLICRMSVSVSRVWAIPPPIFEERRLMLFARMRDLSREFEWPHPVRV